MKFELKEVAAIWAEAPHSAFTSLVSFSGKLFCAFREGLDHASEDGRIRVITSDDGRNWKSVALFSTPDAALQDLRDPKLCELPDGRLMVLSGATSRSENSPRRNYLWFSSDGESWSRPELLDEESLWFWSVAPHNEKLYFSGYAPMRTGRGVALYQSANLPNVEKLVELRSDACFPNETAIAFWEDQGVALIRRELAEGQVSMPPFNNGTALLATSSSPFLEWEITDLGVYVGGPVLLRLPDGGVIMAGRKNIGGIHQCSLWKLDLKERCVNELLTLSSGGDCSYPGLVWHDGELLISYYSSHEGTTQIYLARLEGTSLSSSNASSALVASYS